MIIVMQLFFGARRIYDSITTVSMRKHLLTKVMGGKLGPSSDPLILLNFSFGYSMFGTYFICTIVSGNLESKNL